MCRLAALLLLIPGLACGQSLSAYVEGSLHPRADVTVSAEGQTDLLRGKASVTHSVWQEAVERRLKATFGMTKGTVGAGLVYLRDAILDGPIRVQSHGSALGSEFRVNTNGVRGSVVILPLRLSVAGATPPKVTYRTELRGDHLRLLFRGEVLGVGSASNETAVGYSVGRYTLYLRYGTVAGPYEIHERPAIALTAEI